MIPTKADIDEEVVHVESLTGFIAYLPIGVEDGGVETIYISTSQSVLNIISHSLGRGLALRIRLTNQGNMYSCLLYSRDDR